MHDAKIVLNAVTNDCQIYWNQYYEMGMAVGAVFVFLYSLVLLYRFFHDRDMRKESIFRACMKMPFIALLGFYCYLVLGITVLSRTQEETHILKLVPFSTWGTDPASLTFWVENIMMLVPLGILLYILWEPFRRTGWSLLAGGFFSLSIEGIQLVTRLGKFETDDIMNNIFGMLIGTLLCKGISRIFSIFYENISDNLLKN